MEQKNNERHRNHSASEARSHFDAQADAQSTAHVDGTPGPPGLPTANKQGQPDKTDTSAASAALISGPQNTHMRSSRTVQVRLARLREAEQISQIITGLASHLLMEQDGTGAEKFLQSIMPDSIERYIMNPHYRYMVSSIDDELTGIVAVRDASHILHLFVPEKFQQKGMASILWNHAKEYILSVGITKSITVNASLSAYPVYEHFGFTMAGTCTERNGIVFIPMRLSLKGMLTRH